MDNSQSFEKIIILGSGKLAYQCAVESRKRLQDVEVLEYKVTESTVLEKLCQKEGIPYRCCEKQELFATLYGLEVKTLLVSASNTYLIDQQIIQKENLTIINWHNALLPRHKGRNAEAWCIYEGDSVTGITWHLITEQVDAGDILIQKEIAIEENTTALRLFQQQCDLGVQTYTEMLDAILQGNYTVSAQKKPDREQLHLSRQVPNGGVFDLNWDYRQMSLFLRAMDYGALQLMGDMYVSFEGRTYQFRKYKLSEGEVSDSIIFRDGNLILNKENHTVILKALQMCDT